MAFFKSKAARKRASAFLRLKQALVDYGFFDQAALFPSEGINKDGHMNYEMANRLFNTPDHFFIYISGEELKVLLDAGKANDVYQRIRSKTLTALEGIPEENRPPLTNHVGVLTAERVAQLGTHPWYPLSSNIVQHIPSVGQVDGVMGIIIDEIPSQMTIAANHTLPVNALLEGISVLPKGTLDGLHNDTYQSETANYIILAAALRANHQTIFERVGKEPFGDAQACAFINALSIYQDARMEPNLCKALYGAIAMRGFVTGAAETFCGVGVDSKEAFAPLQREFEQFRMAVVFARAGIKMPTTAQKEAVEHFLVTHDMMHKARAENIFSIHSWDTDFRRTNDNRADLYEGELQRLSKTEPLSSASLNAVLARDEEGYIAMLRNPFDIFTGFVTLYSFDRDCLQRDYPHICRPILANIAAIKEGLMRNKPAPVSPSGAPAQKRPTDLKT